MQRHRCFYRRQRRRTITKKPTPCTEQQQYSANEARNHQHQLHQQQYRRQFIEKPSSIQRHQSREDSQKKQQQIRFIRFQSKILNDIRSTPPLTPTQTARTSAINDNTNPDVASRLKNDIDLSGNGADATSSAGVTTTLGNGDKSHSDLDFYEVICRINYGDFRKVHVQFVSSDRKVCAFAWKRKRRLQQQKQKQKFRKQHHQELMTTCYRSHDHDQNEQYSSTPFSSLSSLSTTMTTAAADGLAVKTPWKYFNNDNDVGVEIDVENEESGWVADDEDHSEMSEDAGTSRKLYNDFYCKSCQLSNFAKFRRENAACGDNEKGNEAYDIMKSSVANIIEKILHNGESSAVDKCCDDEGKDDADDGDGNAVIDGCHDCNDNCDVVCNYINGCVPNDNYCNCHIGDHANSTFCSETDCDVDGGGDHNRLTPPAQQHQQHQQQQPIFTAATPRGTAALIKRNCITPNASNGIGNRHTSNSNNNNNISGNSNKSNNSSIDANRSRRSWGSRSPTPTAEQQQENANCLPVQKQQQEQQKQQHNEEKCKEKAQQQQINDKKNSNNNGVTTTPPSSPSPTIKTTTPSSPSLTIKTTPASATTTATPTRSGSNKSLTSSPVLNRQNAGKCKRSDVTTKSPTTKPTTSITATTTATTRTTTRTASAALAAAATIHAATTLNKENSEIKSIANDSPQKFHQLIPQRFVEEGISWEPLRITELPNFKYLNRHSINGCLDYDSLERFLQRTTDTQHKQNRGFEAMGALLQYLIFDFLDRLIMFEDMEPIESTKMDIDSSWNTFCKEYVGQIKHRKLDAFSCSRVKYERTKANEKLNRTLRQLDEARSICSELQDQLCEKEAYYMQREEELQALHRCELEKVQQNLSNIQLRADEEISSLKIEFSRRETEEKRSYESYRLQMESKLDEAQTQLLDAQQNEEVLLDRVSELEKNLHNLDHKLKTSEENSAIRLQAVTKREQELLEKLKSLNKELDVLRESKANNERELRDKLNLSQEEVSVLRTSSRRSLNNDSLGVSGSPRNSSSASAAAAALEITRLQSEAESLRCVLELKQKEISKLNKQNEELMRDADERTALQGKISLLEARNEMLQSELEIKSEKEKDFLRQIDEIQKAFNHETVKRTRISYDNEALQWQLKQRSEQLHLVEAKLQELSSQDLQLSHNSSIGSLNRSHNGTSFLNVHPDDDISPPASPVIKAIIEKADSVSWVLEMDDETPEVAASKMVKRAGSFRSVERSPSTRRQLSLSANAAVPTSQGSCNPNSGGVSGPNPLSQSMSAASVIRQHSNETVDSLGRINSRTRSKSVSVKSPEPTTAKTNKKISRQSSIGNSRKHELAPPGTWKEPIGSSSPYAGVRPRSSTLKSPDHQEDCYYRTASTRKLITCDSSALNTGERLDIRGLPTHPSIQDLKSQKKNQQIQESAGEAMVSGTNSEDEACSHSSDEVVSASTASISSAASATSGSSLSLNRMKNHHQHMSLEEEVLLLDKINSLNGTPMEVSWSDEADVFATNGVSSI